MDIISELLYIVLLITYIRLHSLLVFCSPGLIYNSYHKRFRVGLLLNAGGQNTMRTISAVGHN